MSGGEDSPGNKKRAQEQDCRAKGRLCHDQEQSRSRPPTSGLPGRGSCSLFDLTDNWKSPKKKECQREPKRRQMLLLQQERVSREKKKNDGPSSA